MSFNKVILVGNLGRDPELRHTTQGLAVCAFSVATNERRKDRNGEPQDVATWFRVTVWGKQAESVSKYLSKGRSVYVEGRLHVGEWTDKDGNARHSLEINASDVHFIGGAGSNGDAEGVPVTYQETYDNTAVAVQPARQQTTVGGAAPDNAARRRGGAARGAVATGDDDIPF